jgi:hypothetical protein
MQQVNLPKQNKPKPKSQKSKSAKTTANNSSNSNQSMSDRQMPSKKMKTNSNRAPKSNGLQKPPQDDSADPWGSAWDDPWGSKQDNDTQEKKLTPQERTEMIKKIYQEVLGREPDTRDINYYKYSTLGEDEIFKQIITGKEHKKLIADGKEYKSVSSRASQSDVRIKVLEGQIKDQVVEFRQLTELLQEKNRYINQLRASSQNPYSFTSNTVDNVKQGHMHYSQDVSPTEGVNQVPQESAPPQPTSNFQQPDKPINNEVEQQNTLPPLQQTPQNNQELPIQNSGIQFGNSLSNPTPPKKQSKVKDFLKTVLDL